MNKPDTIASTDGVGTNLQASATRHRLKSVELLGKAREVIIEHGSDEYRLRLTSQGKLILTK